MLLISGYRSLSIPLQSLAPIQAPSNQQLLRQAMRWNAERRKTAERVSQWRPLSANGKLNSSIEAESNDVVKKRKIVEHITLLKAKPDLSDIDEKDMLDYLFTTQYQMSGILAISLGRVEHQNVDNVTHAFCLRFHKKEELSKFYSNPYYMKVLEEHVSPNCYGLMYVDYESEVEDDIMHIFRRGEEFSYGVEWVLLMSIIENTPQHAVLDALATLQKMIARYHSSIVQVTQGENLNVNDSEYTHAATIHFQSDAALNTFKDSLEYKHMWRTKFEPITRKSLGLQYTVDPVGTELM